tara:strand:- start:342 stop:977 length:636 start_codon:yes stop_codon:yes gene_type:complete
MKTILRDSDNEEFEHYRMQVMLLKHIANSIEGAEFDLQRKPGDEYCWEIGNVTWDDNYRVTFPDCEFAPTSVEIHLNKILSNPIAPDPLTDHDSIDLFSEEYRNQEDTRYYNNKNLETDQTLCGIKIDDEIYFHCEESDDATLLEAITLEREKLEQTKQESLEEVLKYPILRTERTYEELIADHESQIVNLYGKIEFLNNIEKIIREYETK